MAMTFCKEDETTVILSAFRLYVRSLLTRQPILLYFPLAIDTS